MNKEVMNLTQGNNGDVKTISSREVAEMMEVRHCDLLDKINGINKSLLNGKIRTVKYWVESTYKDSTGRKLREYQVTKKGCEMLAHKSTGEKGVIFTDRYMDKFEEMENALRQIDSYMIEDPVKRATRWIEEEKERQRLAAIAIDQALQIEEMKPDAEFGKAVQESEGSIGSGAMCAILQQNGIKVGTKTLLKNLRDLGYLSKRKGSDWNRPLPKWIDRGWFEVRENIIELSNGGEIKGCTTMFTGVGQKEILQLYKELYK